MVPPGISSAAAVRVGQAVGRRAGTGACGRVGSDSGRWQCDVARRRRFCPQFRQRSCGSSQTIRRRSLSALPLGIAAIFQLFDGIQVVCTGALRGLGNTRTPMLTNLVGHWVLGLPLGCLLAFNRGFGVFGVWIGLCLGLIIVAMVLLAVWARESKSPL
jgi:MATE family multidrug resistance protein